MHHHQAVTRELPTGTVTFVFTDIEASTRLLLELGGDRYADALSEHRRIVREVFRRHGGIEVDTQGDAFFYAFGRASDAVSAATETQDALAGGPVRVRMGVHTGEPTVTEEGYVGLDLHRAARISAAAYGGQIVLSQTTRDLVDAEVRDLGLHRLKDLSEPQRLFQVGGGTFPPLRTLHRTNLPVPATAFLGRARELEQALELLSRPAVRLLTLTGAGGTGKTRLALQVAAETAESYPDGVFWTGLARLRDPQLVVPAIAQALDAQEELARHIGDKRMLMLLDNFEQVVDAAGDVAALGRACPGLDLLVTSREPLHVAAESVYAVPPLEQHDAVSLFNDRALAVRHDFTGDGAVIEICRRLDGLPLAIELAAARVNALSPTSILERLDRRLPLLTGGPRDAPERQRTLRATLDWSHGLLRGEEQRLFARLAVFAGGCRLEAAEAVCRADVSVLASLVDKSLIRHSSGRYWMLETIREYASERLDQLGERDTLTRALANHLLALADAANARRVLPGSRMLELGDELDNLRAAVAWARTAEPELALRLAIEAGWFASGTGVVAAEQSGWLDEGLRTVTDASPGVRARALAVAASVAWSVGDLPRCRTLNENALRLAREAGDDRQTVLCLLGLGNVAIASRDLVGARQSFKDAAAFAEAQGDRLALGWTLHSQGELERAAGNLAEASDLLERSATLLQSEGDIRPLTRVLHGAGDVALAQGDVSRAAQLYRRTVRMAYDLKLWSTIPYCVAGLAAVTAMSDDATRAGVLWGGVTTLEREVGWALRDLDRAGYEEIVGRCSNAEPVAFAAGAEQGRRMTPDEVIEYAVAASP